jgi:hypothetical protein
MDILDAKISFYNVLVPKQKKTEKNKQVPLE